MSASAGRARDPSSWDERLPLIVLALAGLAVSTYLAMYQLGVVHSPWDPIFGSSSSARALHSFISRALPIPDASLGAIGYAGEVILGAVGGSQRWRRRPWVVVLYGLLALGMAAVGVGLVLTQAFVVRSWCALCLLSATISVAVFLLLASREAAATIGYLLREHEHGESLWRALAGSSARRSGSAP